VAYDLPVDTALVVFTRDLRLHDNPALALACSRARQVLPVFVVDPALSAPRRRMSFLTQSLACLRLGLRERGADLAVRRGDPVAEVATCPVTRRGENSGCVPRARPSGPTWYVRPA
jgi:deoxyribodipyrimidine photolyase